METTVKKCNITSDCNIKDPELRSLINLSSTKSDLSGNMDHSGFQKSQLPNTSIDDSPFMSLRSTKLRKKKTQTKSTFLKQNSKKKICASTRNECESDNKNGGVHKEIGSSLISEDPSNNNVPSENKCNNKKEGAVRACAVCWKQFDNNTDQMQHMKTCATKHNLTLKQLLDALDLQTKQIEERKFLGLPCVPTTSTTRKGTSKKNSSAKDINDPDLQLGLALSVSMNESEEQKHLVEQEMMLEAGLCDEVAEKQVSLLERFGFTSTRPVLSSMYSRARPGKIKLKGTPPLLVRTQDERERLITEKVAIILTHKEESKLISPLPGDHTLSTTSYEPQSEVLSQLQKQECPLWKKASVSPCLNDCDSNIYYIEPLSHVITPSEMKTGSKLKHISQVPCRIKTPEKPSPVTDESLNMSMMLGSEEKFNDNSQNSTGCENITDIIPPIHGRIQSEKRNLAPNTTITRISEKSTGFIHNLADNWKKLLNNSSMSDLKIHVRDDEIYVHELVLFVRCPNMLEDMKEECKGTNTYKYITWGEISMTCALALLDYLYCGSLCKIDELDVMQREEVILLCTKYHIEELCNYLKVAVNEKEHIAPEPYEEVSSNSFTDIQDVKLQQNQLHGARVGESPLVQAETSQSKISTETKQSASRNEPSRNINFDDRDVILVHSAEGDDLHDTCISPDPFSDSCERNITKYSCNQKSESPDTQKNMDHLLEVLSDDKIMESKCSDKNVYSGITVTCGNLKESPDVEIINIEEHDKSGSCTSKKRKNSDSFNNSGAKQICCNDRYSVRKSLLQHFLVEGEKILPDKKEVSSDLSQSSCDSVSIMETVKIEKQSVLTSDVVAELHCNSDEVMDCNEGTEIDVRTPSRNKLAPRNSPCVSSTEKLCDINHTPTGKKLTPKGSPSVSSTEKLCVLGHAHTRIKFRPSSPSVSSTSSTSSTCLNEKKFGYIFYTPSGKKLTPKSNRSVSTTKQSCVLSHAHTGKKCTSRSSPSVRSSCSTEKVCDLNHEEDDMCVLGDFCADYEYQNLYANYSLNSGEASNSMSHEKNFIKNISPISSPLSVKSLPSEDSFALSHKNKSPGEKILSTRRRSSSDDISDDGAASSSSPISVKCLSQSSIHLKTKYDTHRAHNKNADSIENYVLKPNVSSQIEMQNLTTPTGGTKTPNRSLNSVKRLLEDSFSADLERNLLERKFDYFESTSCSTPISKESRMSVHSKKQNSVLDKTCITPVADYSGMDTPMLKRELQKYGLKPLKRKRAKQILKHIYNELHPAVPLEENDTRLESGDGTRDGILPLPYSTNHSPKVSPNGKHHKKKNNPQKEDNATSNPAGENEVFSENDASFSSTQESTSSSQCEFEVPEDLIEDGALTQTDVSELPAVVHKYISSNPVIHQQVLLYEPIWLEHLQEALKSQNYKFKMDQLMEYLDEQCITYRTSQGSKSRKREKKEKKS